jgi:hypothetical protein
MEMTVLYEGETLMVKTICLMTPIEGSWGLEGAEREKRKRER